MLAGNMRMWAVNVRRKMGIVKMQAETGDKTGEQSEIDEAQ
jgi:hypothetical protein